MARSKGERGWPAPPEALPVAVVDNHTHLDSVVTWRADGWHRDGDGRAADGPAADLAAHLERAAAVGVTRMVQVGCDVEAIAWTDRVVQDHPQLLGAVAIHPNEAVRHAGVVEAAPDGLEPEEPYEVGLADAIDVVERAARGNPRIRAIGETGLDHFRAGPRGRAVQREAFRTHVALAKELGLALQIHDRDAHDEVVEVLLADGAPDRTVFHCFSGDAGLARLAVAHGWYLSFAGPVSFGANDALRDALREVPPSLLLVETDAPYLTVHPFRGRPNAPYLLPGTVRTVAEVTGRPLDDVCTALAATSEAVYGSW
ncbi:TatD family hydrolase [Cellulomonas humilata]|uniref:TatD family hydrolase n=1 Tax=Cellulomonas humilata TaxID=144055 RepID=A0A7Y6A1E8_9CELL|nr:TatD family hydrolase [Cellulomonas humilata]NUU16892.1 TatD family hydrolase [Cellulomonas humilata]